MGLFTFTANTNDQLTATSHGLATGDGPVRVWNIAGGLPAPLAKDTDYWAINVDANTFYLATSQANALLGTRIDITTTGTGTHYLGKGLPYCRPRTYAALAQLQSADLNAIFDAIDNMQFPLGREPTIAPYGFSLQTGSAWTINTNGYIVSPAGTSEIIIAIPVSAGMRIRDVVVSVYGDGATDTTFNVARTTAGGADSPTLLLSGGVDTNRSAAWADLALSSLAAFTAHTFLEGQACFLRIGPNAANYRVSNIRPIIDRP